MPGYDWTDDSGTVVPEKSGYNYNTGTSWGNTSNNSGSGSGNNNYYGSNVDEEQGFTADPVDTSAWQEAYTSMADSGQWGGGMGGGVYDKGPVVYPKQFYTPEGWSEVQKYGWSDKLYKGKIQGKTPAEWILSANDPKTVGGKFSSLPEGVIYSSNANDGRGGFIKTSDFNQSGGGGGGGPGWGGYRGWGGSSQYGNPLGRYSKANWHLKNKYNYDSPIAALFAERRANPVQPQNIRLFTEMMANMNKGGIMSLRR